MMKTYRYFKDVDDAIVRKEYKTPESYYDFLDIAIRKGLQDLTLTDTVMITIVYVLLKQGFTLKEMDAFYPDKKGLVEDGSIHQIVMATDNLTFELFVNGRLSIYATDNISVDRLVKIIQNILDKGC